MINDHSQYILLKSPKDSYIATFETFDEVVPKIGSYPEYYHSEIFPNRKVSMWFKLTNIIKINNLEVLNKVVVKSSRTPILESTKKSMNSQFYTVAKYDFEI